MLQLDELRLELESLTGRIADLGDAIGLEKRKQEVAALEEQAMAPDFWDDMEQAQKVMQKTQQHKRVIEQFEGLRTAHEDALTMVEIAEDEQDDSMVAEIKEALDAVKADLETQNLATLLSGEYDAKNAILTFHAGAGGTEAQDWAQMLYRMYTRWAERHDFSYEVLDYLDGEEAGIKSASLLIKGMNAYGYLKGESGVHRLVRISPFDASGRRHTSFAALEVMPEIDDEITVEIRDEDLRVDTYRSGGAGGQHVNKTESAVRITHLPTGVVVACQNERSQMQNRAVAMKMLRSKLVEIKERENLERIEDIKGEQMQNGWGSQIRSYVFMPYTLAKDHRTGFENGNIQAVMDGEIDGFITAYLKAASKGEL